MSKAHVLLEADMREASTQEYNVEFTRGVYNYSKPSDNGPAVS